MDRSAVIIGLVAVGLASCRCDAEPAGTVDGSAEVDARPNVLILMWDTVRADRMSVYGHSRPTTPRLEALAREAVVFERAVSPGMWTVPAHGSMFTGLPVSTHGANARWIWLDGRFITMAEHLSEAGYETWAWSSNPYLSEGSNLLQGFSTVHLAWSGDWAMKAGQATQAKLIPTDRSVEISPAFDRGAHGAGWPEHLTAYKDGSGVAREAFSEWLDQQSDGPWLAYLNLLEAHHPRVPSRASRERLLSEELLQAGLSTEASLLRTMSYMEERASFSEDELTAVRGVYDATLLDLDQVTGQILDDLAARGVLDDTVVVVVSDHGEHLGEHGMFDHRWSVWQELLHVPLLVRYPRGMPAERVAEPVSTQQLFPTVCALTAVDCPPGLPLASLTEAPADRVFAELVQPTPRLPMVRQALDGLDPNRWRRRYQVVFEGSDKLIRTSEGQKWLFDLSTDPIEAQDLAADRSERVDELMVGVRSWREGLVRYDAAARDPTDQPHSLLKPDAEALEQLRLLGYVAEEDP